MSFETTNPDDFNTIYNQVNPLYTKDRKRNLCDTCKFTFPSCEAQLGEVNFGDAIGNDNVIVCKIWEAK